MRKLHLLAWAMLLIFALESPGAWAADEVAPHHRPVKEVANYRISVGTQGTLPLYVSADWSNPLPDVTRAVLVLSRTAMPMSISNPPRRLRPQPATPASPAS
jgi:hypothetical protein